jgi:hypothetical protein
MKAADDVWWCRSPQISVVYGSGERRIALHINKPLKRNIQRCGQSPLDHVNLTTTVILR